MSATSHPRERAYGLLFEQTQRCRQKFKSHLKDHSSRRVQHTSNRFDKWCESTGAHLPGHRSLDERLRDASKLRGSVHDCLDGIEDAMAAIRDEGDDDTGRSESDVPDQALNDFLSSFGSQDPIKHVNSMIDNLLRIAVLIRPGLSADRFEMAQKTKLEDDGLLEDGRLEDEHYLEETFREPKLDARLRARLLMASSKRRRMLAYTAGRYALFQITAEQQAGTTAIGTGVNVPTSADTRAALYAESITSAVSKDRSVSKGWDMRSFVSQSDASSVASGFSAPGQQQRFGYPRFQLDNDQGYRVCPACYLLVYLPTERDWRKHILSDLRPYVCTYPDCNFDPDQMYSSRRAWFTHELTFHRRQWPCPFEDQDVFDNRLAFETHLEQKHHGKLGDMSRQALAKGQEIPPDAVGTCPFCSSQLKSKKRIRSHIGDHQRQLALMAMATGDEDEDLEDQDPEAESVDDEEEDRAQAMADDLPAASSNEAGQTTAATAIGQENDGPKSVRPPAVASQALHGRFEAGEQVSGDNALIVHGNVTFNTPSLDTHEWRGAVVDNVRSFDATPLEWTRKSTTGLQNKSWILLRTFDRTYPNRTLYLGQLLKTPRDYDYGAILADSPGVEADVIESTHRHWQLNVSVAKGQELHLRAASLHTFMIRPSSRYALDVLTLNGTGDPAGSMLGRFLPETLGYLVTGLRVADGLEVSSGTEASKDRGIAMGVAGVPLEIDVGITASTQQAFTVDEQVIVAYSVAQLKRSRGGAVTVRSFGKGDVF